MRPIPTDSTDLFYSRHFAREDLLELGHALGVSDIKIITTATLAPKRALYHACLNGIQTHLRIAAIGEADRAKEIADLADTMYEALLPAFEESLRQRQPALAQKAQQANDFCAQIHAIESAQSWNAVRYDAQWNPADYPQRWQKKAIENYRLIRQRIAAGDYTPSPHWNAETLTRYWSERNLEYKHYRDASRSLVDCYLAQHFPQDAQITMHPASARTMTSFVGGMGSGKSELTAYYLQQIPPEDRANRVLHNADFLKYALYRSAVRDGAFPAGHRYSGPEVQAESSNALYEGTRKRTYLARQEFHAPDVVVNSTVLGHFELQESLASGGALHVHHLFTPPEDAIAEALQRSATLQRAPSAEDIRWSAAAAAKSMRVLAEPDYAGAAILAHLYHRRAGNAPQHYATIDTKHHAIHIHDVPMLMKFCHAAYEQETPQQSLEMFLQQFHQAGYEIERVQQPVRPRSTSEELFDHLLHSITGPVTKVTTPRLLANHRSEGVLYAQR